MVRNFVVRTLYHLVFVKLLGALVAERMAARQGNRLLVVVVVGFETDTTFEY